VELVALLITQIPVLYLTLVLLALMEQAAVVAVEVAATLELT
jgi:hypothetical protein